jgi:uncharacterized protein (TIGR00288 family)
MASSSENISMAVFCDFENVALGVRDANYEKFDIKPVLERLLLKGSIVVKKAYCDWDRYKSFKGTMHEANFELIEIPHVRQSGKNSADIRMVVDALDLCYTKAHVDTFVIVSGDSDFSPLVSKLRENAKRVIGVGVKQSTSDLLVANCDEFIFYDDLVREIRRAAAKRDERKAQPQQGRRPSDENNRKKEEMEARKLQALEMVVETFDALVSERGDTGKIWASLLKDTLKRRRPDFSETYYGFRTFGNLLEEAQTRGLFEFGRDEKSGTYVYRSSNAQQAEPLGAVLEAEPADAVEEGGAELPLEQAVAEAPARESRRRGGRGRKSREQQSSEQQGSEPATVEADADARASWPAPTPDLAEAAPEEAPVELSPVEALEDAAAAAAASGATAEPAVAEEAPAPKERRRAPRKPAARKRTADVAVAAETAAEIAAAPDAPAAPAQEAAALAADGAASLATDLAGGVDAGTEGEGAESDQAARKKSSRPAHKAPSRKPAARTRRPAKPKAPSEG